MSLQKPIELVDVLKLLEFAKWTAKQSCCNVCHCIPCEAVAVLREIGISKWSNE